MEVMAACRSGMVDIDDLEGDQGIIEYIEYHGVEGHHRV